MSKVLRFVAFGLAALAWVLPCSTAQAATVVVGSPLSFEFKSNVNVAGLTSTMTNSVLGEEGANVTSPVTGTIVRWRTKGTYAGAYRLRVMQPTEGGGYVGGAASTFQSPTGPSLETFSTNLPIQVGDTIGLDADTEEAKYSMESSATSHYTLYSPVFTDGAPSNAVAFNSGEAGFDAIVVPTPTVILTGPASGPLAGGTAVTIAGRDLEGATAVRFGPGAASASFTVDSDNEITAVAPPGAEPGTVDVTVTTPGGTSAAVPGDHFTYTSSSQPSPARPPSPLAAPPTCVVPNLIGKSMKGAKKTLARANCSLGKVRKPQGVKAKAGRVTKQAPKAGKTAVEGTKVNIKLG